MAREAKETTELRLKVPSELLEECERRLGQRDIKEYLRLRMVELCSVKDILLHDTIRQVVPYEKVEHIQVSETWIENGAMQIKRRTIRCRT